MKESLKEIPSLRISEFWRNSVNQTGSLPAPCKRSGQVVSTPSLVYSSYSCALVDSDASNQLGIVTGQRCIGQR
jgi:hypothetical protein